MRNIFSCLLCILVMAGCHRGPVNVPEKAAEDFFVLLDKGKYRDAYDSAAFGFRAPQSEAGFEAISRDMGFNKYPSRKWTVQSNDGKMARMEGEFSDSSLTKVPLRVTLVVESGRWKVFSLFTPTWDGKGTFVDRFNRIGRGQSFGDMFARKVPPDKQIRELVSDTMQQFNDGLHRRNFDDFYTHTSMLWQSETSREKVERAFKAFVDADIKIDAIKDTKAVWDEPPRLNSEGALLVKGYYPTQPNRVIFDLKYTFELPKWKLLGVTISIKP